jgi:hypothetical protein
LHSASVLELLGATSGNHLVRRVDVAGALDQVHRDFGKPGTQLPADVLNAQMDIIRLAADPQTQGLEVPP